MIKTFDELMDRVKKMPRTTIAVAVAQDEDVLKAVDLAYRAGVVRAILVGDAAEIRRIAEKNALDLSAHQVIDAPDNAEACRKAVELVRDGKATLPMKGFVDTSVFLKAVLNKEYGLSRGRLISHVALFGVSGFDRLLLVTDSAMNIAPELKEKADIIRNAVEVAHALGNPLPKVAVLCAVEKVNPKMTATVDAKQLTVMNEMGEISGCLVKGPLALDNAVSLEAARHKGIEHPVAGTADVLMVPDIEAGNLLNKSMEYFGHAEKAGVIVGAKVPVILTSRASSDETKMHSIVLSVLVAAHYAEDGIA